MNICHYGAPSCVIQGTVAENVHFLNGKVAEVGLCFFEIDSCLAYSDIDLPLDFGNFPLKWHIHLPCDLPWHTGGDEPAHLSLALLEKVKFLNPHLVVLHPPDLKNKSLLLQSFIKTWRKHSAIPVLLENLSFCNLTDIKDIIIEHDFKICLDVAHALSFGHYNLLNDVSLLDRTQLIHWSAPGKMDEHLALTELTAAELAAIKKLTAYLPKGAAHLLEIFNWRGIELSIPILDKILI